jgi:hypothetical protein
MLGIIDSESARGGQPIAFVITHDVVADGQVVVRRGTHVNGVVVKAQPAHWGAFHHDHAELMFRFETTTGGDGQVIRLRASALPEEKNPVVVVVDRYRRRHEYQWVSEADTFTAYVAGAYEF